MNTNYKYTVQYTKTIRCYKGSVKEGETKMKFLVQVMFAIIVFNVHRLLKMYCTCNICYE